MDNPEKLKPMGSSAFMSVKDYERAIAASTEKDENGNPIPNFKAVEGSVLVWNLDDESAEIVQRQKEPEPKNPIYAALQEMKDAINEETSLKGK